MPQLLSDSGELLLQLRAKRREALVAVGPAHGATGGFAEARRGDRVDRTRTQSTLLGSPAQEGPDENSRAYGERADPLRTANLVGRHGKRVGARPGFRPEFADGLHRVDVELGAAAVRNP